METFWRVFEGHEIFFQKNSKENQVNDVNRPIEH